MSYDVTVMGEDFNCTSNMGRFFDDFDAYPPDWDGMHRADVAERIERAIARIESTSLEDLKSRYDAPSGWGKVENAVEMLKAVHAACVKPAPSEIVGVRH